MNSKRGKNLTPTRVREIVGIIENLPGKASWQAVIEAIERTLYTRYTRQALHAHDEIGKALSARRQGIADSEGRRQMGGQTVADARAERYRAEIRRLETENGRLLQQFVVWAYNAYLHGMTEEMLNKPLPPVDRGQTR